MMIGGVLRDSVPEAGVSPNSGMPSRSQNTGSCDPRANVQRKAFSVRLRPSGGTCTFLDETAHISSERMMPGEKKVMQP